MLGKGSSVLANSKMRVVALAGAALIVAAGATWYLAAPAWTLHQMKAAADANDAQALDSYIDYPALREDLKTEIKGQMIAEAKKDKSGFGGLGLAIGKAIIGPVIEGLVTPDGIRAALMAKRGQELTGTASHASSALRVPNDPVIERRGFSEFLVASKQRPKSGLVFKRRGFSWKLSGVQLAPTD
jgi:hypothetical protein